MLPNEDSLDSTRTLITEHIEKRIKEIEELGLRDNQVLDTVEGKRKKNVTPTYITVHKPSF